MKVKINSLPEKYEDIILPLMNVNPKLTLGGSLALYILDIMEYDFTNRKPDLDFSLLEPLTVEELASIKDFFNFQYKIGYNDYNIINEDSTENGVKITTKIKPLEYFLKKDLIQLFKLDNNGDTDYSVDFFNSTYLPKKELVIIDYKGYELRLSHPSYILSHKSKYAYDNRVGKQYKHFQDLQKIDWKNYFQIIKKFNSNYQQTEDGRFMSITHYSYGLETDNIPF